MTLLRSLGTAVAAGAIIASVPATGFAQAVDSISKAEALSRKAAALSKRADALNKMADSLTQTADSLTQTAGQLSPHYAKKPEAPVPFAFGDFTWVNGNTRAHTSPLDAKYF